jgi:hypothetical protein
MTAMTCERFEAILPDYFEGDLGDDAKAAADAHAMTCESCAKLVADINRITTEAAALPAMRPARDLWSGIEGRISAPVIPLAHPGRSTAQPFASRWILAAAAVLVVTTAGVTYVVTSRIAAPQPQRMAVATPKPATSATTATPSASGADSLVRAPSVQPERETPGTRAPSAHIPSATLASNDRSARGVTSPGTSPQMDTTYAREIELLERMVAAPRSGLDPATVQVVRRNLQVIDDAIAQSKAALVKDPASSLLYNQMTRAMSKKVELLRTMASLSSST